MTVRPLLIAFLLSASLVWAQAGIAHRGVVRSARQPIPGATVTASLADRKLLTSTDENGEYSFETLEPGSWILVVEIFGFRISRQTVAVAADRPPTEWNLELEARIVAAPAEDPEPQIQLQPTELEPPQPAAHVEFPQHSEDPGANDAFLINGSLSRGLQAPAPEESPDPAAVPALPSAGAAAPSPASFGTGARVPGASPGRAAVARAVAARVAAARAARARGAGFGNRRKKGKTAAIRGSAYWRFRDSALDARPFSINGDVLPKPDYSQNRFGITAGGPLKIPKLLTGERSFFYLNYDGTLASNPFSAVATVPTPAERAGDFSQSVTRGPVIVYDNLNRQPFPGNVMPGSRIDPIALGLMPYVPPPNQGSRVQNYQIALSIPQHTHTLGARFNHGVGRKNRLAIGYNLNFRDGENAQVYGFRDITEGRGHRAEVGWTRNFTAKLINNFRTVLNRNRYRMMPFFAFGRDVAGELGIAGTSRDPANFGPPNLRFTNFGDLNDGVPVLRRDQTFSLNDSLSWVRGRHTFSFGGEFRRIHLDNSTDPSGRGSFSFSGLATSALDNSGQPLGNTGFDFADFLLGRPQSSSVRFGLRDTYFRSTEYSAFVNDEFRVKPNLTLSLGLRYEYFSPLSEKNGHLSNLDIAPDFTGVSRVTPAVAGAYSGVFPSALIEPDRNNLAPRLGMAWKPSRKSKLQVRAGYSWYYNGGVFGNFAPRLAAQPPFAQSGNLTTSINNPLSLADGFSTAATSDKITNTYAVDRSYLVGYAQTWNFAVQKELPQALVLEIGYIGTKGTRLDLQRMPNRAAPGSPLTSEERRRIGNATGFTWDSAEGNSIYHGAQVRLTRRFKSGLSSSALYTWSKSIDNASNMGGGGNVVAQNDRDLRSERGLSSFDRRHSLNLSFFYASLVGGKGSRIHPQSFAGRLLASWSMGGGISILGGTPLTARVLGNRADSGGTGVVGSGRADATGESIGGDRFFNPGAFTLPPSGRFGNAGRNTIIGPGFYTLYASVGRSFRLSERRRLEVRLEGGNLTNHVNFLNVGAVVNASNYGLPLHAGQMRSLSANVRYRF